MPPTAAADGEPPTIVYTDPRLERLPSAMQEELHSLVQSLLAATVGLLVGALDDAAFASASGRFIGRILRLYDKRTE